MEEIHFETSTSTDNESPHLDCEHPINRIHSNLGNPNKQVSTFFLHLIKVANFSELQENNAITLILLLKKIRLLMSLKVAKELNLPLTKSKIKLKPFGLKSRKCSGY